MEFALTKDATDASVIRGGIGNDTMDVVGQYTAECFNSAGDLLWSETYDNLVTTQGKNHLLDNGLAGPASAVAARMSLITSGTPVIGDTYATHAGFVELANTVVAARGTPSFSAASAGVKATSSAVSFSIVGSGTIVGSAINVVVGTVGNLGVVVDTATSSAILYSAGLFGASKSVTSGDTLNVTYSTTLT
jgi:hypothetical protein